MSSSKLFLSLAIFSLSYLVGGALEIQAKEITALAKIYSMAKDKTCENDSQCLTIGIGNKACGGPEKYLVYSRLKTNPEEIGKAVASYNENVQRINAEKNMFSTCSIVPVPITKCAQGVCQEFQGFQNQSGPVMDQ